MGPTSPGHSHHQVAWPRLAMARKEAASDGYPHLHRGHWKKQLARLLPTTAKVIIIIILIILIIININIIMDITCININFYNRTHIINISIHITNTINIIILILILNIIIIVSLSTHLSLLSSRTDPSHMNLTIISFTYDPHNMILHI